MNVRNRLLTILALLLSTSCMVEKGEVNIKLPGAKNFRNSEITKATVTNVQIINDQLVITGTNLNVVTNIKTENASKSFSESFTIESKSSSQIIANSNSPLSFAVNSLFNLVLSNSYGAATFQINFSLCDATINGKGINCSVVANDKDVLSYDSLSDTWKPRQVNGLNYLGTFDASPGIAPTAQPSGSYYVISVSGTIGAINFDVGDWIVSNGSAYQKIDNSTAIISVFGRTGAVSGVEGDYSLDLLSDVDLLTTPPTAGKILKYNGTQWVVSDDLSSGGAGSVSSSEIADGTIATADLANNAVTDAKINSVAASKITGTLTGTQIGTGVITNSHIASGAAIDYTKLNITNNTIPYAHINVGAGEIAQDRIAGFSTALANLLTGTITNGDTTHAPTGDAVFDALGLKLNLTGGTLSVGTINGVPTPVNGDDVVNKAYVDSAVTGVTTTANDKVSKTGDTMTGALVLPANGLTVGTNQLTVSGGNVGIGTSSASNLLSVTGSNLINNGILLRNEQTPAGNNYPSIAIENFAGSGTGHPFIALKNSSGDINTPQVTAINNSLGAFIGYAHNGTSFVQGGRLDYRLRGTPGSTYAETDFAISLGGSSDNQFERLTIKGNTGNVGIGTSVPAEKLDVVGNVNATQLCISGDCKSTWPTGLSGSSVGSTEISDGSIVNADINASAAIAQSKIAGLTTDLSNKQPLDAGLTNLSSYNTNGILVQSTDNTFVGRSIAGTANRVDITNGDGVAGNPTININPTLFPSPTASGYFLKSTGADASVWSLLSSGDITSALGFTPVNKSGDTISTGTIAFNAIGTLSLGYTPTNLTDATSKSYVDNLVATAANQWTESSGNIYRNSGNVGIGIIAPAHLLDLFQSYSLVTSDNKILLNNTVVSNVGSNQTSYTRAANFRVRNQITSGNTQSGYSMGVSVGAMRNDFTTTGDSGTLVNLTGARIQYGHEQQSAATPITTNVYGISLEPYKASGTIDTIYDLFIKSPTGGGGAVNKHYGIYIEGSTKENFIQGNLGIGTTTPTQKLDVAGNIASNDNFFTLKTFADGWAVGDYQEFVQANQFGGAGNSGVFKITLSGTRGNWTESTTFTTIGSHADSDVWREIPASMVNYYTTHGHRCFTVDANTGLNVVKFRIRAINPSSICSGTSTGDFPIYVKATSEGYNAGWTTLSGSGTGATVTGFRTTFGSEWNLYTGASRNAGIQTITAKDGNVGIGTTSPLSKLDVSGNIGTNGTLYNPAVGNDGFVGLASDSAAGTATSGVRAWGRSNASYPGDLHFISRDAGAIRFYNYNGSTWNEQARVSSTGNFGIGTITPSYKLEVAGSGNFTTSSAGGIQLALENTTMTSTNKRLRFIQDNASNVTRVSNNADTINYMSYQMDTGNIGIGTTNPQATLDVNGSIRLGTSSLNSDRIYFNSAYYYIVNQGATVGVHLQNGATSWGAQSDRRLKKEIEPVDDALSKLQEITGVTYHYKVDKEKEPRRVGVIAQDVEKVLPEAVSKDEKGFLFVRYSELVPLTINAIKEFYSEFKVLVTKVLGIELKVEKNTRAIASIEEKNKLLEKENLAMKKRAEKLEAENREVKKALCELGKKAFCR